MVNDVTQQQFILTDLTHHIDKAKSFCFLVAFITTEGINLLKTHLFDFSQRNVHGKIIISSYLGFNQPATMRELLKFSNVSVRLAPDNKNIHAKFFLFEHEKEHVLIVGSSNLTKNGL